LYQLSQYLEQLDSSRATGEESLKEVAISLCAVDRLLGMCLRMLVCMYVCIGTFIKRYVFLHIYTHK
jgi:hypothetical protein